MTETTAPEVSRLDEGGPARSFGDLVMAAFWSTSMNWVAVAWVCMLAIITVLIPFIANGQPFTILLHEAKGPVRAYPMFATLSNVDLALFVFTVMGAIFYFMLRRSRLKKQEREVRRRWLVRWAAVLVAISGIATGALFTFRSPYLSSYDYRDYQAMLRNGKASGAVFTLIPWHYADFEPMEKDRTNESPSREHWLGTDSIGRDVLSRLLWSTRVIMGIGFISETIALLIGVAMGALIGYFSGIMDLIGMRLVEIFESIPLFFLILIFIAIYGRQIFMIMVILGLVGWTGIARLLRAEFLRLRGMDFVQAAIAQGLPLRRILFRHMLPNGITPVMVTFTFGVAGAIMSESGLSFLGVGVEPPIPSWGQMLNEVLIGAGTFRWWLAVPPGVMIFLTVFAYNMIGEGMRDALDPRTNSAL